ncbi:hypothetical protein DYU05_13270 [Mucilaginibacter terrenus]|uniref:Uncharacterized protein n=1 Tax=Mucilaginibacter terrenus TaxID=2482727 RepID=A0A3E2NQ29_9SPHI|nr:hypothetical protein [Mucilaginibacter terrenus]RFZ83114.1 hypothetical protein DYU05_13270 [Mucilaginibacter terrenus]
MRTGKKIAYNNNVYKVLDKKGKTFTVEDMEGGKTKVSPNDGLFKSLVNAKNNPEEQQLIVQEEEVSHSIGR